MKNLRKLGLLAILSSSLLGQAPVPAKGFIPDAKTAVAVAEAVLSPIYGEEVVKHERPFHAELKNNMWIVTGSLPQEAIGGVAEIRIDKRSGAIVSFIHGK